MSIDTARIDKFVNTMRNSLCDGENYDMAVLEGFKVAEEIDTDDMVEYIETFPAAKEKLVDYLEIMNDLGVENPIFEVFFVSYAVKFCEMFARESDHEITAEEMDKIMLLVMKLLGIVIRSPLLPDIIEAIDGDKE